MNRVLQAWARFDGHREALVDVGTGRRWTYAQLHRDALCWAGRLAAEGVGPGDVVAVLAHNRGESLAVLYAAAELGAIFFPLNWRLSVPELRWQLGHSGARVLLTDAGHATVLDRPSLSLDDGPGPTAYQGPGAGAEDPWMLLYTSGSSGRPKGALIPHRQAHHNAVNTVLACDLTREDTTLTFTPLFHTGGLNCLTTPLFFRGGRVVLTPGFDAAQALALVAQERISLLMGVPTIFQLLHDHPAFGHADLSSVRDALCGGAPLGADLLARYLDRGIPLRQGFGMTECGPNCFGTPPDQVRQRLGTVGQPIHFLGTRVVRPDGTSCDADEPGELQFKGPMVFAGYLGNPDATAASFTGDGWFKTGDVLSVDADGYYTVRGRLKEMYISGGENVYPAEVEAVLLQCPGVAQAAVVGVPDPRWGEVGHAFLEPQPGVTLDPETVRAFVAPRLARFKQPRHVDVRPLLPRTGSGKIDKLALRQTPLEA